MLSTWSFGFAPGRLNTMILQNIGYGFKRQQVAEIGQRSLNSAIAPASILPGHSNHQRGNIGSRSRSPWATIRASIILLGDQPSMPSQQRLGSHDRGDVV